MLKGGGEGGSAQRSPYNIQDDNPSTLVRKGKERKGKERKGKERNPALPKEWAWIWYWYAVRAIIRRNGKGGWGKVEGETAPTHSPSPCLLGGNRP